MTAFDADDGNFGEVKYFIISDKNNIFRLDPDTGILYPRKSLNGMTGNLKTCFFLSFFQCIQLFSQIWPHK